MIWTKMISWFWIGRARIIRSRVTRIAPTKIDSIWWSKSSIGMWWLNGNGPNHIIAQFAPHRVSPVSISQIKMCIRWIVLGQHCLKRNRLLVSVMLQRHSHHGYHHVSPNVWRKWASTHRSQHTKQQPPKMHRKKCSSQADSSAIYLNFTSTMNFCRFRGKRNSVYKCITWKYIIKITTEAIDRKSKQTMCIGSMAEETFIICKKKWKQENVTKQLSNCRSAKSFTIEYRLELFEFFYTCIKKPYIFILLGISPFFTGNGRYKNYFKH